MWSNITNSPIFQTNSIYRFPCNSRIQTQASYTRDLMQHSPPLRYPEIFLHGHMCTYDLYSTQCTWSRDPRQCPIRLLVHRLEIRIHDFNQLRTESSPAFWTWTCRSEIQQSSLSPQSLFPRQWSLSNSCLQQPAKKRTCLITVHVTYDTYPSQS